MYFVGMKTKFVAYYRVSTQMQGISGNGIQAQKQSVARYLTSIDCELVGSFEEVESGSINKRPQLAKAIQLAKAQKAVLVIAKLDRLSRNAAFLLQLQDSNIDFIACDMPNADKFSVGILALLAQKEREMTSQRTKAALQVLKQKPGVKLGNPNAAKAWPMAVQAIKAGKQEFAKSALKIIREIQGTGVETLSKIADCLNKRGEKTARDGVWTATAVKRVLSCAAVQ
jgi:DNA invertase Pin-like site-specific DNA recombinase